MTKVVINRCFGGFGLSEDAMSLYKQHKGINDVELYDWEIARDDPILVQVVEELGPKAEGGFSELMIVDIPNDVEWQVEEYDGREWIAEKHRVWP